MRSLRVSIGAIYFAIFFLSGCIENVNLSPDNYEKRIIIEGQITNESKLYQVTVSYTGDYTSEAHARVEPVSGATVFIKSTDGDEVYLTETNPGIYQSIFNNYTGEIGKSYYVEVALPQGDTYQSLPETLHSVPQIKDLNVTSSSEKIVNSANNIVDVYYANLYVDADIPSDFENVYLKWYVEGEFQYVDQSFFPKICYVKDFIGLEKVIILGEDDIDNKNLINHQIFKLESNWKFAYTYCFHVYQESLTKNAYEYWRKVGILKNNSGSFFDPPPGRISGNLRNVTNPDEEVLGYFFASAVDTSRIFIQPYEIEGVPFRCGDTPDSNSNCYLCTDLASASSTKPPYWK